jgi:hypothetical protein
VTDRTVASCGSRPTAASGDGLFRLGTDSTVTTLVDGLYFANGVTATADESALVFAETMGRRLSKYWLTGPPRAPVIRKLLWRLPERLQPKVQPEIWVVAFDANSGKASGGIRTTHPDSGGVTGVVESGGNRKSDHRVSRPSRTSSCSTCAEIDALVVASRTSPPKRPFGRPASITVVTLTTSATAWLRGNRAKIA